MLVEAAILLTCAILALHLYSKKRFSYFDDKGVLYDKPLPVLGNMGYVMLKIKNFMYMFQDMYMKYQTERYIGFFDNYNPVVLIRDPELIRLITVKDFDHFVDHRKFVDDKQDELFGKSLIALDGDKWREMRATLSPAFTGSKLRHMVPHVAACASQIVNFILEEAKKQDGSMDIELTDLFTRYTNDVIASVAFGLEVNSIKDRENQFFLKGKKVSNFTGWQLLKAQLAMTFPKIAKALKITFFEPEVVDFFRDLVANTMKYREENNVIRNDIIHILMEAKKGTLTHETHEMLDDAGFSTVEESDIGKEQVIRKWSNDVLAAQAFLFFFAGFDTASTVLCYTTHELAVNPDIQKKLREEIDALGKDMPTYEDIQNMKYLDMVVSETLRLWPPAPLTDRKCTRTYVLPPPKEGGKTYTIEKGSIVFMAVNGIHRDPKYWVNPTKFDPERFNDENKHNIQPFTYMPFGVGPRNCIASRFALIDVKIALFYLIKKFYISPNSSTMDPIVFSRDQVTMKLKGGFHARLSVRKD